GEAICTEDFGGPALPGSDIFLTSPSGPSLAERLIAYPPAVGEALARYARWHLGCDLGEVHGSAAIPLAINRVFPRDADLHALAFSAQTFTAEGVCFRVSVYESGGKTLVTAECVAEAEPQAVAAEVARLLAGFEGKLKLGERLATAIKPRWIYHSTDAIERLA